MADALIARSLKLLQCQAGETIGIVELLGTHARIPLRLEHRKLVTDLFETHAIRALVRASILRNFDRTSGHDASHDLRQVTYAVVVRGLTHVERFVEHVVRWSLECSNECSGNILNMYNWSPGRPVRFQVNFPSSECPGD